MVHVASVLSPNTLSTNTNSIALAVTGDSSKCSNCLRDVNFVHCPACGSSYIYGYATRRDLQSLVEQSSGKVTQVSLRVFKCRRCGLIFNEATPCEAPKYQTMRDKRAVEKAAEQLAVNDDGSQNPQRKALLETLFQNVKSGGG